MGKLIHFLLLTLLVGVFLLADMVVALAEVAVFSNRTRQKMTITTLSDGNSAARLELDIGESRAVFYRSSLRISHESDAIGKGVEVQPKSAYFFTRGPEGTGPLRMQQIGFGENEPLASPLAPVRLGNQQDRTTVTVKIVVDDDEPTHRRIWEGKLRNRISKASALLSRQCGIKLKVVAVETWDSDDRQHDFNRSMREFEREVVPSPAQLAIGFSSQYKVNTSRHHVGGTRGVLYPYIMLKERSPKTMDRERLELLLHELGHYFGASHSPEPQSIMRPLLTSSVQRQAGSRIQYDPVNTLLIALVADEIRNRDIKNLRQVSRPTKLRMQEIYSVLVKALPKDPAAGQFLQMLGASALPSVPRQKLKTPDRTLSRNASRVLGSLVSAVEARRPKDADAENARWYEGDSLTQFYVSRAALAALQFDPENAGRVYLTALGIYMDRTGALQKFPVTSRLVLEVETEHTRKRRLKILGKPTIYDRQDLAAHFFLSAYLTATFGADPAFNVGIAKEISDANGGTGFSFADLAADRAGVEFAKQVMSGQVSLDTLSEQFNIADYVPPVEDLAEGLSLEEFHKQYGDVKSAAFKEKLAEIEQLVLDLPGYRNSTTDN